MDPGHLADLVVLAHLLFILFAILGGLLARWNPLAALLHLPALAWAAYVTFTGTICPLTPIEVALRREAGQAGYRGGFVEHYLIPLIYPPGLTRPLQMALGAAIVLANVAIYAWALRRRRGG